MVHRRTCMKPVVCFLGMLCVAAMCFAQEEKGEEQDNRKVQPHSIYDEWMPRWVLFGGTGITVPAPPDGNADTSDSRQLVSFGGAFEFGLSLELSYLGLTYNKFNSGRLLLSAGTTFPVAAKRIRGTRFELPLTVGYTRMIGIVSGNAVNFGAGMDVILSDYKGIRFEVRDYLKLSGTKEHNIAFRVAFLSLFED